MLAPEWGHFWPKGYNLNNLGSGPLDEATYQISKDLGILVTVKKIFKGFPYVSLCKTLWPLGWGQFWPQGYNLNNLGRGTLDEATYQISRTWAFWFQTRFLKVFPYKGLYITCDP